MAHTLGTSEDLWVLMCVPWTPPHLVSKRNN